MKRLSANERGLLNAVAGGSTEGQIRRELGLDDREFARAWKRLGEKIAGIQPQDQDEYALLLSYERGLRRLAMHQAEASEARLRALMDIAPEAVLIVEGRSGRVLSANNESEVLFGYSRRELQRLKVEDLIEDDLKDLHVRYRLGFLNSDRKRALGYHPRIFAVTKAGERLELAIALTSTPGTDDVMVVCTLRSNVADTVGHPVSDPS